MTGIVTGIHKKSGNRSNKSYGFITSEGESYYFRLNGLELQLGELVDFKGGRNEKGNFATDIHVVA